MAQLNLRDRLIETTIAYIGSDSRAGVTNFTRVQQDLLRGRAGAIEETTVGGGRMISLDWRPREGATFNDCDLTVKLVSVEGASPEAMQRVLVDADGLVLMLDSDPDADDGNRRAVAAVRDAVARASEKRLPVVVQLNRREEADEPPSFDAIVGEEWPRVGACSTKGDGVMETLQRAVDVVVESMRAPHGVDPGVQRPAPRAEGNPLLGALRQMLQATVTEHVSALEGRVMALLERLMRGHEENASAMADRVASIDARVGGVQAGLEVRMGGIEAALVAVGAQVAAAGERVSGAGGAVATRGDVERIATRVALDADAHREGTEKRLASLEAWLERVESTVIEASERTTAAREALASKADLERVAARASADTTAVRDAVVSELKDLKKGVRDESSRMAGAATLPLQRSLDAMAVELKKAVASSAAIEHAAAIERLGAGSDELRAQGEAVLAESRATAARVGELTAEVLQLDTQVGRRFAEIRDALRTASELTDARAEGLQTQLTTLIEELQKKKKSWFS